MKFRVRASYTKYHYADIEADSADEAYQIGCDMDQSEFIDQGDGEWNLEKCEQPEELR